MIKGAFTYVFIIWSMIAYGQSKYFVEVHPQELAAELDFSPIKAYDSLIIIQQVKELILSFQSDNYLLANIDSITYQDSLSTVYLFKGEKYQLSEIDYSDEVGELINAAGIGSLRYSTKRIDTLFVNKYLNDVLTYLINHGYPFAQVGFKDVEVDALSIKARLEVDKGINITYDTMNFVKMRPVAGQYLSRYLNIRKGQPYRHKTILDIKKKIKDLNFIALDGEPYVSFIEDQAMVRMPLKRLPSSSFDFLIGILPSIENGRRRFNINGEASADLLNRFGYGERITINLRRLKADDQLLSVKAGYPYVAGLPLGVDGLFELRLNRNISIDMNANLGGQYITSGINYIKAFGSVKTSRIINYDTTAIVNSRKLPQNLDFRFRGGGLEYFRQDLDYRFNPRKGYSIQSVLDLGVREILINEGLRNIRTEDVDFSGAYDTVSLSTFQASFDVTASVFTPVSTFGAVRVGLTGGLRLNEGKTLENELYRIGGNKLLRGFDELSILADYYGVLSTEFRLIIDQNSYLSFPFIDLSRMRTYIEGSPRWDTAYGVGMGLNFATNAGIFNISFAAGSRLGNPVDFNNTKVHFGYVSLF